MQHETDLLCLLSGLFVDPYPVTSTSKESDLGTTVLSPSMCSLCAPRKRPA